MIINYYVVLRRLPESALFLGVLFVFECCLASSTDLDRLLAEVTI